MRRCRLLFVLALYVVASPASGIEFTAVGATSFTGLTPGDPFTISLEVTNTSGDAVQGLVADVTGLSGVANVVGGQTALHHFVGICATFVGGCGAGIDTVDGVFFSPVDLSHGVSVGDNEVRVLSALSLTPTTFSGASDPGLLPDINSIFTPSDLDIVLNLVAVDSGVLTLEVFSSNGVSTFVVPVNLEFTVGVIPEPATALLFGLGLVGLAGASRRAETLR